jgi:hypothetical protein
MAIVHLDQRSRWTNYALTWARPNPFLSISMPVARMLQHVVFVYLANTAVLCYTMTMICCCQVQDYIYWIISTENDHRHHHKFIKYEKRLRKEGKNMLGLPTHVSNKIFATSAQVWMRSTSLSSFQRSNWSPTYILHLFHLEDTMYFTSIHFSLWFHQSPLSSTRWHFLFCSRTTCCLLLLNSVHAQDGFT